MVCCNFSALVTMLCIFSEPVTFFDSLSLENPEKTKSYKNLSILVQLKVGTYAKPGSEKYFSINRFLYSSVNLRGKHPHGETILFTKIQ